MAGFWVDKKDDIFWGVVVQDRDGDSELSIGRLPDRKNYALYATVDGEVEPLAYFVSDAAAEFAVEYIKRIVRTN